MGNIVINAFGGEGTLFTRTFLAAMPAWPWADPTNTLILLRWLDLANGAQGEGGAQTDAEKTARMRISYDQNADVIAEVFGVPKLNTAAPEISQGALSIAEAYRTHPDSELLNLMFTQEEQEIPHGKGFQGDPCAGTACIRALEHPLPEGFYDPQMGGTQLKPSLWVTVGGFRGGGCATTLVPLEAIERMKQENMQGVPSVLVAALPYSSHVDPQGDGNIQLKSKNAYCGTKAILSGGFDIKHWTKRYFISSYLEDGELYRPLTAGFSVDEQDTTLIATNLITADCVYRAAAGLDDAAAFGNDKTYVPKIDGEIKNVNGYGMQINATRMRALCWFAAAVKELVANWDTCNNNAKLNADAKTVVSKLNAHCALMMEAFAEMQKGRYEQGGDTKALSIKLMPDIFFDLYKNTNNENTTDWWEKIAQGAPGKEDDFKAGGLFRRNPYATRTTLAAQILGPALDSCEHNIVAALKQIFETILEDTENWGYAEHNSARTGDGARMLLPLKSALPGENYVPFGLADALETDCSVMGAVNSEASKSEWDGFIGGSCGRFYDFGAHVKKVDPTKEASLRAAETDPVVVKYTSLLLSYILRDLREIPLRVSEYMLNGQEGTIFDDMRKHLNLGRAIHIGEIGGVKVCEFMNAITATKPTGEEIAVSSAYFLLPTPGEWGAKYQGTKKNEKGEDVPQYDYEVSAWPELVGYQLKERRPPKSIREVLEDLTDLELQLVYTMLYALVHYNAGHSNQIFGTETGTVPIRYAFAAGLLTHLEQRVGSMLDKNVGAMNVYGSASWEDFDPDDPVCRFIKDEPYNPNKFFSRMLAYYHMERQANSEIGGIYTAYPLTELGTGWLKAFQTGELTVNAEFDEVGAAKKVTATVTFKRKNASIEEKRTFVYDAEDLVLMATAPAISMVPQFLGYEQNGTVKRTFRYLWAVFNSLNDKDQRPCRVKTDKPGLKLMIDNLPKEESWKLCQKKQLTPKDIVDSAWSATSDEERFWWNICNIANPDVRYGCLGRDPIKITRSKVPVTKQLTIADPIPYELELYFDFGTANSHIEVYEKNPETHRITTPAGQSDVTAFEPGASEIYLTLDLQDREYINDGILKLHDENLTPTTLREKTIPTMIQAYGKFPNEQYMEADQVYGYDDDSVQYEHGRIVYPDKDTMNRIYEYAIRKGDKNEKGEEEFIVRSLTELGFCDQMKISTNDTDKKAEMKAMRRFFILGFIQNVVARYYTKKCAWPSDILLYCSYPTNALRDEYYKMLQKIFPSGSYTKDSNFKSEAISFVCYGPKDTKDAVTIDIGAGTTDIALCRYGGSEDINGTTVITWLLKRTASLQFAGMRIIEQSIVESLKKDSIDSGDIFVGMDENRKKMLKALTKDASNPDALRMLIRNLISDEFLNSKPNDFPPQLRIRMVLRTVGLLMAVRDMLDETWEDYILFLHGGPIKSLKSICVGEDDYEFKEIVRLIFGREARWDDDKKAITRGMKRLVQGECKIGKTEQYTDENGNTQTRPCYQHNLLEQGDRTVFDSPNEPNAHNVAYKSFDVRPYAEAVIKAVCGIAPDSQTAFSDANLFANKVRSQRIRDIVDLVEKAIGEAAETIKEEMKKCQYYEGMESGILTMYAIDKALESLDLSGLVEA